MQIKDDSDSGVRERRLLIAMITNPAFLGQVSDKWNKEFFFSKYSSIVADWCVKYFLKHADAPRKMVESLFEIWASKTRNAAAVELVEKALMGLSDEYERDITEDNVDHLVDVAKIHFSHVQLQKLSTGIEGHLANGDVEKAEELLRKFNKVEIGQGSFVNAYEDETAWERWFAAREEPTIIWPKALGEFFRDSFQPDSLIAFLAGEKVGKTWWLLETAYQATRQRKKVAFFSVGDMSENQLGMRLAARHARHPFRTEGKWPCEIQYPITITPPRPGDFWASLTFETRRFDEALSIKKTKEAFHRFTHNVIKSKTPHLLISVHPNDSLSVMGIRSILDNKERQDGWTPDVLIIDYADILASPAGKKEEQEQINTTWKQLRALSQIRHCCVVTATQAKATSYESDKKIDPDKPKKPSLLTRNSFSRDKRILAHVTGMVGINVNNVEKEMGLRQLNWIVAREMEYSYTKTVHVAGCLALANPAVLSVMGHGDTKKP